MHLSDRYYNRDMGRWESKFDMFHARVGMHPARVQNMHLTYTLLLRAVIEIRPKLEHVRFGVRDEENVRAKVFARIACLSG